MFDLVGTITNTPLNIETNVANRAQFYFDVIDALVESGQRLTITSGLRLYENAVIKSYSVPRNARTGQSIEVSLRIIEIRVVDSATVQVPADILSAALKASGKSKRKKAAAPQAPTEDQNNKRKSSVLYALTN
jgi:hypothetical protein